MSDRRSSTQTNFKPNTESESTIMASTYNGLDIGGKVVLVTGGTTGLGKAIAMGLASAGAKVVAGSSSAGKVDAVARELGAGHHAMQIDVTDESSVEMAVKTTVEKFGRLDAVVNAAGVIARAPSIDFKVSEFERIVKVNLTGSFIVAKTAAKAMLNNAPDARGHRGSIVFIASLNSYISLSEVLAYASSKSGVLGLGARVGQRVGAQRPARQRHCAGRFSNGLEQALDRRHAARRMAEKAHPRGPLRRQRRTGRRDDLSAKPIGKLHQRPHTNRRRRVSVARGVKESAGCRSANERDTREIASDQRIEFVVIGCDNVPVQLLRQRQRKAVRQGNLSNFGFQSPDSSPKGLALIATLANADALQILDRRACCPDIRTSEKVVIDLAKVDSMCETTVGGISEDRFHEIRAGLVPQKCDHRTGVKNAVHRRLSSLEISRCLAAAKAVLLARTWAYFPRTFLTSACRRE
jgi:NAD(P)-dependent dehydrogenase (short-subunit alcohol dehydrogenase family)